MNTPSPGDVAEVFHGHYYGAAVVDLCVDGDYAGHGHITPRRFLAACNRYHRAMTGAGLLASGDAVAATDASLEALVEHRWATLVPAASLEHDWLLNWNGIIADTPGAFPITLGIWS